MALLTVIVIAALAVVLTVPTTRTSMAAALGLDPAPGSHPVLRDSRVRTAPDLRIATQPGAPAPFRHSAGPIRLNGPTSYFSWALLERRAGTLTGSANHATGVSTTESTVKVWIAADYLRRLGARAPTAARVAQLSRMIRDSDNADTQDIYKAGGGNPVIRRMISVCGLTETAVADGRWSRTQVSARDSVRLGLCVADGRAAGRKWTPWLLAEMRQVRGAVGEEPGGGRWGIIDGLPIEVVSQVAIKNGWTIVAGEWRVNCLAVHDEWVLAVFARYTVARGKKYGADICRTVTEQLTGA